MTFSELSSGLCCSYAFMLPAATPPNAIVFSASNMRVRDMILTGLMLNVICVLQTVLAINTWGVLIFGLWDFPDWTREFALKHGSNCTAKL